MKFETKISNVRDIIKEWKENSFTIGFVPTMGYLHEGHISLIKKAARENNKVVVSIFVNPTQFGPNEDFDNYPRDLDMDKKLCKEAFVDLIFCPDTVEMYPTKNLAYIDIEDLGENLCGAKRVGHFRGVCSVVAKLLNITTPNKAYFGEKDAQQLAIIKRMTRDLNFNTEIIPCPIVRDPDGLAMSSRNKYLSPDERSSALVIPNSLELAKKAIHSGEKSSETIKELIKNHISNSTYAKIDYIEIVDADSLKPVSIINIKTLVAVAVFINKTRLIDNFTI